MERPARLRHATVVALCAASMACATLDGLVVDFATNSTLAGPAETNGTPPNSESRAVHWGALHILHPNLAERIASLEARSVVLRAALERIAAGIVPVYIGTAEQGRTIPGVPAAALGGWPRWLGDVLIHALWGHLVPLALTGNVSGRCTDALGREWRSCAERRENALRTSMNLPEKRWR